MDKLLLTQLESTFQKCSDCLLHPEYPPLLQQLDDMVLTQPLVDYLCDKATSKKHIWEIRFMHLRILLRNPSAQSFDLKGFYKANIGKSRRPAMKLFWIRGFAMYATEKELNPIMEKFRNTLEGPHGTADINDILSVAGLPYLVKTYGYPCFVQTLETAKETQQRIHPLLRDFYTLDERMEQVNLLSPEERHKRTMAYLEEQRAKTQPK